ncbi:MAG: DUF2167 domain-containing protein [Myxococcota bacterium]
MRASAIVVMLAWALGGASAAAQEPELPPEGDPAADADALPELPEGFELPPGHELTPEEIQELALELRQQQAFEDSLDRQEGTIELGDGLAALALDARYRFLSPDDTDRVLQAWGNPPQPNHLGMVIPADVSLFGDESWAVIVDWQEDGYVEDDDAEDMDYDELLEEMQSDTVAENAQRQQLGLPTVNLVGWAEPPHYDAVQKRIYWAKELDFGEASRTVNYDIRVLGRRGVLSMSAVGGMEQLPLLKPAMEDLMTKVQFHEGHRYVDFDPDVDEVAAYGIGGLIAGKVLAKSGFFAVILAFLLKAKKLLILVVIAIAAFARKLFGGGGGGEEDLEPPPASPSGDGVG